MRDEQHDSGYEAKVPFGEYVRQLRNRKNLSLRDVEAEVGISASHLSQIERGEKNPPKPEMLRRLARLYEESMNAMFVAAGLQEADSPEDYSRQQIERAFRYVVEDPEYRFGTHMNASDLTLEAKLFVIEMYAKATGTDLLARLKRQGELPS